MSTNTADAQRTILDRARIALMSGDSAGAHSVSLILDRTIQIPVYAWARVERDFSRLIAKAKGRGLPAPLLTELSRDEMHVTASVLGGAPVFNGWSLVADLESRTLEDGTRSNIIRTATGRECPAAYRDAPEQCLHCGLDRRRNRTFVLEHEDGRTTQVGSTCLDEYIGADALSAWLSWPILEAAADDWACLSWDEDEFAAYRGDVSQWGTAVPIADYLAAICAESRAHGFASSGSSEHPNLATGRQVWAALQTADQEHVTDADHERAAAVLNMVATMSADTDFAHNLRTIVASGRVEWSDANMVAAAYPIHARELARLNEHVPNVMEGDKVVLDLEVTGKRSWFDEAWETWKYAIEFSDPDLRTVVWFTTSPFDASGNRVDVGNRYRVTAKVKRLGEYKGRRQTELSRPTLRGSDETKKSAPIMRKWAKVRGFDVPSWAMTAAQCKRVTAMTELATA